MLGTISAICTLTMLLLLFRSIVWTTRFLNCVSRADADRSLASPAKVSRVVVVLPVRGQDPYLARCIESILEQDYPDFILRIIVDSESDPSVPIIDHAVSLYSIEQVQVEYLVEAHTTCGAKNSALIQVIESLESDDDVVVVVDSDVIAYPGWLSNLVEPLSDPAVGVSTGVRWFTPQSNEPGTLVRYLWNVGAVPEMLAFQTPFGGSVAYRRDILDRGLTERWSRCLFDDCVVSEALRSQGLKLRIAPRAILANRESITTGRCFGYLRRQMLNALCYTRGSHWIFASSVAMALSSFGAIGVLVAALVNGDSAAAVTAVSGLAAFCAGMAGCLIALEKKLRPIIRRSGQYVPPLPIRTVFAGGLTVLMYAAATVCASLTQRVSWRGLNYRRVGHDRFLLEEHRSYRSQRIRPQPEHASV